jgi:N-sulfoglucosamine sulfohydrolase
MVVLLLAGGAPGQSSAGSGDVRPNILWISAEDICPDLHCYGDPYATTPNLDRLASQGVRFTRAFSTAPVCSPSRCSIITGMYASAVGGHNHRSDVVPPANVRCFTEYLREAGYFCTNNAKTDYNFRAPLTAWDENGKSAHWRNRAAGQPFFSVFNLEVSHESRVINNQGQFDNATRQLSAAERHDPAKAKLPAYYPDTPVVRANWARYCDLITVLDKQVQHLLDELQADGLAENTIVYFWGDHGRCMPRGKRWAYDSGLHVPLIVRWPGHIEAGSVREDLVTLMDLGPTLISLSGQPAPKQMHGRVILGPHTAPAPQYVFATRDRMDETYDMQRSVRDLRYRYVRNFHPELPYAQPIKYMDKSPLLLEWRRLAAEGKLSGAPALFFAPTKPVEELYDLESDPDEVHNLANTPEQRQRVEQMREAMNKWMADILDKGVIPEKELTEKMRPGGKPLVVDAPVMRTGGVPFTSSATVALSCKTAGASIAYTFEKGGDVHWLLYSKPMEINRTCTLRARACRPGYEDSAEVTQVFAKP